MRGQWGQWTMVPRKILTLHKHCQNWLDLGETPPYSTARFTFFLNIMVPRSENHEKHENHIFNIFGGWLFFTDRPGTRPGNQQGPGNFSKLKPGPKEKDMQILINIR